MGMAETGNDGSIEERIKLKEHDMATGEIEVNQHWHELEPILLKIMQEHTVRKGCQWREDALAQIKIDLVLFLERQEVCQEDAV
jgi:hypothetical protein